LKHPARMAASTRTDKPRLPCNLRRDKRAFIQVTSKIVDLLYRRGCHQIEFRLAREAGRVIKARDILRSYLPANPRRRSDLFCQSQGDRRIFSANQRTTVGLSRPIRGRPSDLFRQSVDNRPVFPANPRATVGSFPSIRGQPSGFLGQSAGDRRIYSANRRTTVGLSRPIRGRPSDLFRQSVDNRPVFPANPRATVGSILPIAGQPSGFPGQSAGDRRIFSANRIGPSGFTGQSRLPGIVPSKPSSERPSDHPTAVLRQTITRGKHSVYTMRLLPAFQGSIVVKGGVDGRPVHSGSTY
jgi:hypothetical protein